jgi:opacity protein-like surface antigen
MKALSKYLCALCMFMIVMDASATLPTMKCVPSLQGSKYPWTLGFDANLLYIQPKNDFIYLTYGNRVGAEIYLAYRTPTIWGFEFGYNWTNDKEKSLTVFPGTQLFGATSEHTANYGCKIRLKDTYLDLSAHKMFTFLNRRKWEAKYGIGMGWVRQTIKIHHPRNVPGIEHDPLKIALDRTEGKTRATWRFNVGLQTLFTRVLGMRSILTYQTTSDIEAKGVNYGVNPHMFTNSFSVSLGVFWNVSGYYYHLQDYDG